MTEQIKGHVLYYPPVDKFIVKDSENGMKWEDDITHGLHDLSPIIPLAEILDEFIEDNNIDVDKLVFVAYSRIGSLYQVRHLEIVRYMEHLDEHITIVG
jgi:hypothetical protein